MAAAEHFGQNRRPQMASSQRKPERQIDGSGVGLAASLGEIASCHDSEPGRPASAQPGSPWRST